MTIALGPQATHARARRRRTRQSPLESPPRALELWLLAGVFVATIAVSWLRIPAELHDALWAEDAFIFLAEAVDSDAPGEVLVHGYAGYQHLVPRVLTQLGLTLFPLSAHGVYVFWASITVTGAVAAAVFWLSRQALRWIPARVAVALITAFAPSASIEVLGNLANLHTYFMWMLPWLLVYRPTTRSGVIGWGVVAFLATSTEIQSIVFAPLLIYALRDRPSARSNWGIVAGFTLGLAWQFATFLTSQRQAAGDAKLSVESLVDGWAINAGLVLWEPNREQARTILATSGLTLPFVLLAICLVAALTALILGTRQVRLLALVLPTASGAVYGASAYLNASPAFDYASFSRDVLASAEVSFRWGVVPSMFLAAAVVLAIESLVTRSLGASTLRSKITRSVGVVAIMASTASLVFASLDTGSNRVGAPPWSDQVGSAVQKCAAEPLENVAFDYPPRISTVPISCANIDTWDQGASSR